jgi:cation channel sperm-associated protein 2
MLILLFIVLHGVNVGIMAQFQMQSSLYYSTLQKLEVLDACLLSMFVIDGIIHLLDDWYTYITDGWNILDIGITITIILPGILELIYGVISNPIRALRILSIIKIIIRSESLRTIVITISQAIQSMNYIIMFIAMVGTWFAHVAIYLFSDYVNAEIDGLVFQDYFNSLAASYKTAFILMTLDQVKMF